jgi:flagellar basal-body rod modification protein FlgD
MVDSISNLFNTQNTAGQGAGKSVLGKDDFMRLMIEQLKNQDPLSPADSSEYSAQLAQFSSLEQLANISDAINQSIDANNILTQTINNTLAATLIGKSIKVDGGDFSYKGQKNITLGYNLPSQASSVEINIYDSEGNKVRTITDVPKESGEHKLSWDFTDNNGNKVANGDYKFEVVAKDTSGQELTVEIFKSGIINSIKYTASGTKFVVDDNEYYLSNVTEILNNSNGGK